jgi:hypothetical protein
MNSTQTKKSDIIEILLLVSKAILKLAIPVSVFFYITWQNITFANLNREIRKKSSKREEFYKKNFDLKARITTSTTAEKIESLYIHNRTLDKTYLGNNIITLTLPQDKIGNNSN